MSELRGGELLHAVARRILVRYLERGGSSDVRMYDESDPGARAYELDITYATDSGRHGVKVKSDPYAGADAAKATDRSRSFYRPAAQVYAFETVATTRLPGWVFASAADELFYYYLSIDQTEAEVATLFGESEDVFFTSLKVDADELHIIPFADLRAWFAPRHETYPTRPVVVDGGAAWYRLVPRGDVVEGVPSLRVVGPVFASAAAD